MGKERILPELLLLERTEVCLVFLNLLKVMFISEKNSVGTRAVSAQPVGRPVWMQISSERIYHAEIAHSPIIIYRNGFHFSCAKWSAAGKCSVAAVKSIYCCLSCK